MKPWLGVMGVVLVVACSSACVVSDDETSAGDDEGTTSGVSAREECLAALEAVGDSMCAPGFSFQFQSGGNVPEWNVVPIDEAPIIELPHGYLLEASTETVVYAELFVRNEQCIGGCLISVIPGQPVCMGFDAEGNAACSSFGNPDPEACERFTEACAGG